MPSQNTEVVIEIAPSKTKYGGKPKYISDKIPIGIINPSNASIEMAFWCLNLSWKNSNRNPIKMLRKVNKLPWTCAKRLSKCLPIL